MGLRTQVRIPAMGITWEPPSWEWLLLVPRGAGVGRYSSVGLEGALAVPPFRSLLSSAPRIDSYVGRPANPY
ncbi:hypothetical protein SLA2020_451700 [Shorea laevis]